MISQENIDEAFESAFSSIEWANEQIAELESKIIGFYNSNPFENIKEIDTATGQEIYKVKLIAKLPNRLANLTKDAASNLRDALDHAVYASTRLLTGKQDPGETGFPFGVDAAAVSREVNGKRLKGNAPEIRPVLEAIKPHKGGNDQLYALNRLRNPNTHRLIVPVVAASTSYSMSISGSINGPSQIGYNRWDAKKQETEYMRLGIGSQANFSISISFDVLFDAIEQVQGKSVIATLKDMSREVHNAIDTIKEETRLILASPPPSS
ncbi:hypothetical protein [Rhizobium sp. NPDC090279]|uniref:hypothetical protein n=1 Tax=Rhizobium sp. NPDC090279 TaxID=3364499 RepID=UPI00383BD8D8